MRASYESEGRKPELPLAESAQQVLDFASQEAKNFHHSWVGTEHLLASLARQDDTSLILNQVGVNYFKVSQAIYALFGYGNILVTEEPEIRPDAMSIINKAQEEAQIEGTQHVTSSHLLKAFLREKEGLGIGILEGFLVTPQDVLTALRLINFLKTHENLQATYDNLKSVFNDPKISKETKADFANHVIELAQGYLEKPPTPSSTDQ